MVPLVTICALVTALPSASIRGQDSETQWTPTSMSPMAIAKKVDERLQSLENTTVTYLYQFKLNIGSGKMGGMAAVKNSRTYRVEAPLVGETEKQGVTYEGRIAVGNKLEKSESTDPKKGVIVPYSFHAKLPNQLLSGWMKNNVRYLFASVCSDAGTLEKFVSEAQATPGYRVSADKRTLSVRGTPVSEYRIVVEKAPATGKAKASIFYEVVINSKYYFPISMNNFEKSGKTNYVTSMYMTRWNPRAVDYPERCFDLKAVHIESRALGD